KANFKQRMGRTGRTCPGIHVALVPPETYDRFADNISPELSRISVSYPILRLIDNDINPLDVLKYFCSTEKIRKELGLLKRLEFIKNGKTTSMGSFCSSFPLSIRKSAMLYHLNKMMSDDSKE